MTSTGGDMGQFRNETFLLDMIERAWITSRGDRLWVLHLSLKQDRLDLRVFDELVVWLTTANAEILKSQPEKYRIMFDTVVQDGNQWSAWIEHINEEDMLLDGDDLVLLTPHYSVVLELLGFAPRRFTNTLSNDHVFSTPST